MEYKVSIIEDPPLFKDPVASINYQTKSTGKLTLLENQIEIKTRKYPGFWLFFFSVIYLLIGLMNLFGIHSSFYVYLLIGSVIVFIIMSFYMVKTLMRKESILINLRDIKSMTVHAFPTPLGKENKIINIKTNDNNFWVYPSRRNNTKDVKEILDYIENKK